MKYGLWLGIVGLLLLAALIWYSQRDQGASPPSTLGTNSETSAPSSDGTSTESSSSSEAAGSGQYLTYSGDLLIGSGRRLLFFHAPWCPQCRALEKTIQERGVPDGVTIIKVDYDSNQQLRQQFGVTIQTTLVEIDGSNALIERYVAYDEPSISAVSSHFNLK
ncbi:thioredoxin family protein [Candidatus Berkelbacteria bacterium]|nr:thioredoxin family protein [Candidatus Berkelbacteria bacterium]